MMNFVNIIFYFMAVSYFTFCMSFLESSMSIEISIELCNNIIFFV